MFPTLAVEIKEVGSLDADTLDDQELTDTIVELRKLERQLAAATGRLIGAWDRRGAWRIDGARSPAAALAYRTRDAHPECASRLRLERTLQHLPLVAAAVAAGDLSVAHAKLLARARNARTAELLSRDEAMLVGHAQTLSLAEFGRGVDNGTMNAAPVGSDASDTHVGEGWAEHRRESLWRSGEVTFVRALAPRAVIFATLSAGESELVLRVASAYRAPQTLRVNVDGRTVARLTLLSRDRYGDFAIVVPADRERPAISEIALHFETQVPEGYQFKLDRLRILGRRP